jgi:bifunctional ADP-heptose synthase (sugar kinase/adenylyltransferase)
MKGMELNTTGIVKVAGRKTTIKTRVIGNNHQLMRVDDESLHQLTEPQTTHLSKN